MANYELDPYVSEPGKIGCSHFEQGVGSRLLLVSPV